ncbi:MAG: hypothetical protein JWP87_2184 [Labilithrix sp.]|nr:hypothetical protein [Labilithrix sp.]
MNAERVGSVVREVEALRRAKRVLDADDAALNGLRWADEQDRDHERSPTRTELLGALSVVFAADPSEWGEPYTKPAHDVILRSESSHGLPPLAHAFQEEARKLTTAGENVAAFRHLCAAASIYAAFGCTGASRRNLLRQLCKHAIGLGRLDEAVTAARACLALSEPTDVFIESQQQMVGIALFESARFFEAIPYFQRVLTQRRAMDAAKNRPEWVREAEEWLARARAAVRK